MSDQQNTPKTAGRKPRLFGILMSIAGALVLAIGGMSWSTVAYSGHTGKDGKDGKSGWSVERKIDRMLDRVEASDDQRNRVQAIVKNALADLEKDGDFKRQMWQDLVAAVTKGSIDRDALEALRQRKMENVDRKSQRALTALADAAEVLTPAQRAKLAAEWPRKKWKDRRK